MPSFLYNLSSLPDWSLIAVVVGLSLLTGLGVAIGFLAARQYSGTKRFNLLVLTGVLVGVGCWFGDLLALHAWSFGPSAVMDLAIAACAPLLGSALIIGGLSMGMAMGRYQLWFAVLGGALISCGVVSIQVMSIAALRVPAPVHWNAALVLLAIVNSAFCLTVAFVWLLRTDRRDLRLVGVGVLAAIGFLLQDAMMLAAIILPEDLSLPVLESPINATTTILFLIAINLIGSMTVLLTNLGRARQREVRGINIKASHEVDTLRPERNAVGLSFVDAQHRLVMWNDALREIYRLNDDVLHQGISMIDVYTARKAAGTFVVDFERYEGVFRDSMRQRQSIEQTVELEDGRFINVEFRPMSNGGWFAVHEDITHRGRRGGFGKLTTCDAVTSLPNRASFNEAFANLMTQVQPDKHSFALARIELDRLKSINELFDELVGDKVLVELANRFQRAVPDALIARLSGVEFAIVTKPSTAASAAAKQLSSKLTSVMADPLLVNGQRVDVNCAVGVSSYPKDGQDGETLFSNAGVAMHSARSNGRWAVHIFAPTMDRRVLDHRILQKDLLLAITRDELELYFQPQTKPDGRVLGFEVLLRWNHPTRGMVSPSIFVPLAEEIGFVRVIDEWVLRQASLEAATWANPLSIAVNLSPIDFTEDDLAARVAGILKETNLDPHRLVIEITEGVLIEDSSRALGILYRMKQLGVQIAMDDFGTGYSSLSYLQSFPFDKIKIDRSFINRLEQHPQSAVIIQAIIGLGRSLRLPVIAEGVETEEQRAFLANEGCDEIQGYLVGRPLPIAHYQSVISGKRLQLVSSA